MSPACARVPGAAKRRAAPRAPARCSPAAAGSRRARRPWRVSLPPGRPAANRGLADLRARRDLEIGTEEDDLAALAVGPQHKNLGDERPDLLRRKIDDGYHAPSHQIFGRISIGDLGARSLHPQLAEIDAELDGGPPRFRERLGLEDDPHPHVDALEVGPADRHPFDPRATPFPPRPAPEPAPARLAAGRCHAAYGTDRAPR